MSSSLARKPLPRVSCLYSRERRSPQAVEFLAVKLLQPTTVTHLSMPWMEKVKLRRKLLKIMWLLGKKSPRPAVPLVLKQVEDYPLLLMRWLPQTKNHTSTLWRTIGMTQRSCSSTSFLLHFPSSSSSLLQVNVDRYRWILENWLCLPVASYR